MSTSSGSGLSAEQLRRIEENRHRARQKLASKKPQPGAGCRAAPLSAARSGQVSQLGANSAQSKADGSSLYGNARILNPLPATNVPGGGIATKTLSVKLPQLQSVALSSKPSQHAQGHTATNIKFSALKRTIKANLMLTSKQRFEAVMPYDASAIDIFKRMPSSFYSELSIVTLSIAIVYFTEYDIHPFTQNSCTMYCLCFICVFTSQSVDAKTLTWSFGIETYNKLGMELHSCTVHYMQLLFSL